MAETRKKLKGRLPVGKVLAKLRIDADETLGQMADRLGVHSVHLSKVESGMVNFSMELANRVLEVYGTDVRNMVSEGSRRLVFKFGEVSAEDWNTLVAIYAKTGRDKSAAPAAPAAPAATPSAPVKPAAKAVPDVDGVDFIDDLDSLDDLD